MPGKEIMFYKHWKKILLTATAFFWTSCHYEDDAQPLYGVYCPPEGCTTPEIESSSNETESSSSSEVASSSSIEKSSSSTEALGYSSFSAIYAPPTPCDLIDSAATCDFNALFSSKSPDYTNQIIPISCKKYQCLNNTCTEATAQVNSEHNPPSVCNEDGCVDYSLLSSIQTKYTCSDGKTYSNQDFNIFYHIEKH